MVLTGDMGGAVAETVRVSRELGGDPFLVLHGGGNTSVKSAERIWVKASGFDLAELTSAGLVEMDRSALARMLERESLSDIQMMDDYRAALASADDPSPTIEALLHHTLPFPSVLHTHADAIVALTDTANGVELVRRALGPEVIVLPYVMPGYDLAKRVRTAWQARAADRPTAVVLAHHGLFTCGQTPQEAYDRHLELVGRAVDFVRRETGITIGEPLPPASPAVPAAQLAPLREALAQYATGELVMVQQRDSEITDFLERDQESRISQRGPTTLEHVIRTKRLPMTDGDVAAYVAEYRKYYEGNKHRARGEIRMLDPVPRVILDPHLGLVTTGPNDSAARAVQDIYRHTIRIITVAEMMGGYRTMDEGQAFDIEYWELEQRKLRLAG